jgi:hypothetical protein
VSALSVAQHADDAVHHDRSDENEERGERILAPAAEYSVFMYLKRLTRVDDFPRLRMLFADVKITASSTVDATMSGQLAADGCGEKGVQRSTVRAAIKKSERSLKLTNMKAGAAVHADVAQSFFLNKLLSSRGERSSPSASRKIHIEPTIS